MKSLVRGWLILTGRSKRYEVRYYSRYPYKRNRAVLDMHLSNHRFKSSALREIMRLETARQFHSLGFYIKEHPWPNS